MKPNNRREFLRRSIIISGAGLFTAVNVLDPIKGLGRDTANERINIAVIGINGKGRHHYSRFSKIPNVRVTTLCDVDERLFSECILP